MWHAAALRGAFKALSRRQPSGSVAVAFVPEAEPGFLAAAMVGLDAAGYRLRGHAVRLNDGQAILTWEAARHRAPSEEDIEQRMAEEAEAALRQLGEPATYGYLHVAATVALARGQRLADLWEADDSPPLTRLSETMERMLASGGAFERLEPRVEPESGQYWLVVPRPAATPLSDRVEQLVLEGLRARPSSTLLEIEVAVCERLRGLLSPDRRLVLACLESYAVEGPPGSWTLRPEDEAVRREVDLREIRSLLAGLGERLGYQVDARDGVTWEERGRLAFQFHIQETAALAALLEASPPSAQVVVLPGGRASLAAEKERRDLRFRVWQSQGGRIVKFRHVRRLAEEASVHAGNFADRLGIDPAAREDPQLPLL
jgi:hypothetical protein